MHWGISSFQEITTLYVRNVVKRLIHLEFRKILIISFSAVITKIEIYYQMSIAKRDKNRTNIVTQNSDMIPDYIALNSSALGTARTEGKCIEKNEYG
jgi:hypothetical protein